MSEILTKITAPVTKELSQFKEVFKGSLSVEDELLNKILQHILQRGGKRMRPILTLLIAKALYTKNHGALYRNIVSVHDALSSTEKGVMNKAIHAACSLELLHTASLVHDDVVDEADERRGQPSVNASFNNRLAVLVGDYILSTSLFEISKCHDERMTSCLAQLGQTLSSGEVQQQQNISDTSFSIDAYYEVITKKTAALFEACCILGALSVDASEEDIAKSREFGRNLGIIFQIRDDIFDYYDSKEIGKPTGNDMREGKLTLPILFVLNDKENACPESIVSLARKAKKQECSEVEIQELITYTREHGGISFARHAMEDFYKKAELYLLSEITEKKYSEALLTYLQYVIGREV